MTEYPAWLPTETGVRRVLSLSGGPVLAEVSGDILTLTFLLPVLYNRHQDCHGASAPTRASARDQTDGRHRSELPAGITHSRIDLADRWERASQALSFQPGRDGLDPVDRSSHVAVAVRVESATPASLVARAIRNHLSAAHGQRGHLPGSPHAPDPQLRACDANGRQRRSPATATSLVDEYPPDRDGSRRRS